MSKQKKHKDDATKESFRPGAEEREIFSLVVSVLSKLLDEKKVEIEIDSSGHLDFSFYPLKIKDSVSEEIGDKLSFDNFMQIISTEIESLVGASFYSDKTKGIENNIPSTILEDVGIDEFLSRLQEIGKVINIPNDLKQDLIFKKTVAGQALEEIKWTISNKMFDEELGQLDNCKFATLSIMYSHSGTETNNAVIVGGGFNVQLPTVMEPKQLTLELQKKDVSKLIDNLQLILEKL